MRERIESSESVAEFTIHLAKKLAFSSMSSTYTRDTRLRHWKLDNEFVDFHKPQRLFNQERERTSRIAIQSAQMGSSISTPDAVTSSTFHCGLSSSSSSSIA